MRTKRSMNAFGIGRPVRVAALALLAVGLGGCFWFSEWHPSETDRQGSVELVKIDHQVRFARGETSLAAAERTRLDLFVDTVDLGYGDTVTVAVIGDGDIAERRARLVRTHLAARRIATKLVARQPQAGPPAPSSVTVSVSRNVLVPPKCPDWTKNATRDVFNTQASNLGCATAQARGVMVADPGHLVRGQRIGPGDGEALALGIARYRRGEVTPLVIEEATTAE
ncbi:MAG: CpaD family pilus assembly lipoprotein [Kiloniellales bacterium]